MSVRAITRLGLPRRRRCRRNPPPALACYASAVALCASPISCLHALVAPELGDRHLPPPPPRGRMYLEDPRLPLPVVICVNRPSQTPCRGRASTLKARTPHARSRCQTPHLPGRGGYVLCSTCSGRLRTIAREVIGGERGTLSRFNPMGAGGRGFDRVALAQDAVSPGALAGHESSWLAPPPVCFIYSSRTPRPLSLHRHSPVTVPSVPRDAARVDSGCDRDSEPLSCASRNRPRPPPLGAWADCRDRRRRASG